MADPTIDNARQNIIVRLDNLGVDVSTRHVTPQWREWRWIMQIGADRIIAKREGCSARKVNMTIRSHSSHPISSRWPSKVGYLVGWEWSASATCLQNGLGNARCSALLLRRHGSRTGLCLPRSPFPGNGNSRP
jgi:hypothetical protein